jgi:uroporphyrinogen decarboxylase
MKMSTISMALPPSDATPGGSPGSPALTGRQRFLDACHCRPLERPPAWLMRQAGRALPEYRELKQSHSFLEMVQTPELAVEVTLQPIRRFGFDAAILFSDILVVAEGLGQGYQFRDGKGIEMEFLIQSSADIKRLEVGGITEKLGYTGKALAQLKSKLAGQTALIGFAGSPWTLANFMIEGGGVKEYSKAKSLLHHDPKMFEALMEKLTRAVTIFLQHQIDSGADAVQIFDSLGGLLAGESYRSGSMRWMRRIIDSLHGQVPIIVFSKGVHGNWADLSQCGASIIGIDWNTDLRMAASQLPADVAVQGNLDPFWLTTTPELVARETRAILGTMRGRPGHIFNLGHGVPPAASLANIEALVGTVRDFV